MRRLNLLTVGSLDMPTQIRFLAETGGARRDRTADLYTASVALSQLSYSPAKEGRTLRERRKCVKNNYRFN